MKHRQKKKKIDGGSLGWTVSATTLRPAMAEHLDLLLIVTATVHLYRKLLGGSRLERKFLLLLPLSLSLFFRSFTTCPQGSFLSSQPKEITTSPQQRATQPQQPNPGKQTPYLKCALALRFANSFFFSPFFHKIPAIHFKDKSRRRCGWWGAKWLADVWHHQGLSRGRVRCYLSTVVLYV